MNNKEEVLRLAEEVFEIYGDNIYLGPINVTVKITKLIDLAKAQGAAEEREACAKLCERPIMTLDPTNPCADGIVQALRWNFKETAKAIRNREIKS